MQQNLEWAGWHYVAAMRNVDSLRKKKKTLEEDLEDIRARNPSLFEAIAKDDPSLVKSAE